MPVPIASAGSDASFTFAPGVLIPIVALAGAYVVRWRRAGATGVTPASPWRAAAFAGGILALLVALVSPVDSLADRLMLMHMVQHMLLLDVAPVLLILGLSRVLLRPVTRRLHAVERRAGVFGHPAFAALLYVTVLWVWHVPGLYDRATTHEALHAFEHLTFAVAGGLYWWHLLSPIRSRQRLDGLGVVAYMAGTKVGVGLLGIVLTFAPAAIYPYYEHVPRLWGLSPHADQAVAGAIMALEQSIVMGAALAWLFARMLGESEREQERLERYQGV